MHRPLAMHSAARYRQDTCAHACLNRDCQDAAIKGNIYIIYIYIIDGG